MPFPVIVRTTAAISALVLVSTACGSSGETEASAEPDGVASIVDVETDENDTEDTELAADEAALEFSECMREQGIDFPDIGVDANGNLDLRGAFGDGGINPAEGGFQEGMEACGELIAGAGFGGGGGRAGLTDNPEVEDAFVEFSECLRDAGFDVGDLQLGGPGGGQGGQGQGQGQPPADGEGGGPRGQGQGQGGFGDRDDRLAEQLGLDVEDPEVEAALETCNPILDTAFSNAGFGQP